MGGEEVSLHQSRYRCLCGQDVKVSIFFFSDLPRQTGSWIIALIQVLGVVVSIIYAVVFIIQQWKEPVPSCSA